MEVEKLIEAIRLCGSAPKVEQCRKCSYWSDGNMSKCIPKMTEDAATVIQYLDEGAQEVNKALQEQIAENDKLRAELEKESAARKRQADILCELRGQKYEQISAIDYLRVELKQKGKLVNQQANELERRDKLLKEQEVENEKLRAEVERVKKKNKYSAHDVALILSDAFGDSCACNFNGNDEWLPEKCELLDICPDVVGVACWEQYLKWRGQKED